MIVHLWIYLYVCIWFKNVVRMKYTVLISPKHYIYIYMYKGKNIYEYSIFIYLYMREIYMM